MARSHVGGPGQPEAHAVLNLRRTSESRGQVRLFAAPGIGLPNQSL
jgi:hypothetical protein